MADYKPILCLDFDGVLHSYISGWKGAEVIPDPPVPGALPFLLEAVEHFRVAIFSSRSHQDGGQRAMREWLGYWSVDQKYGLPHDTDLAFLGSIEWPLEKPAAMVTIDDRAVTFDGTWPAIDWLLAFTPWNKKGDSSRNGVVVPKPSHVWCAVRTNHADVIRDTLQVVVNTSVVAFTSEKAARDWVATQAREWIVTLTALDPEIADGGTSV